MPGKVPKVGKMKDQSRGNAKGQNNGSATSRRLNATRAASSDNDERSNKRQRVSMACDQCRKSKNRCDGGRPTCSSCQTFRRSCVYGEPRKRRGLQTGYVRALEVLLGMTFKTIPGSESSVARIMGSSSYRRASVQQDNGRSSEAEGCLLGVWKDSVVFKNIEKLLSCPDRADSDMETEDPRIEDDFIDQDEQDLTWTLQPNEGANSEILQPEIVPNGITGPSADQTFTNDSSNMASPDTLPLNVNNLNPGTTRLSLPVSSHSLLIHYFSYTHCWLPMVEKHKLFRTSYTYSTESGSTAQSHCTSGDFALLWAAFAYTSAQLADNSLQDASNINKRLSPSEMYSQARSFIPLEDEGGYELGHVQALLILSLYKIGMGEWSAAWLLTGRAVLLAVDLGLSASPQVSNMLGSKASHVFLSCFVLDTLLSIRIKRSPHLRQHDVSHLLPLEESGLEEWEPWISPKLNHSGPIRALSTFNQLIRIVCIVSQSLPLSPTLSLDSPQVVLLNLQDWRKHLPDHCELPRSLCNDVQSEPLTLPNVLNLHLVLFTFLGISIRNLPEAERLGNISYPSVTPVLDILLYYNENFGSSAAPSVFEYFVAAAMELPASIPPFSTSFSCSQIKSVLTSIGQIWPSIKPLRLQLAAPGFMNGETSADKAHESVSLTNDNVLHAVPGRSPVDLVSLPHMPTSWRSQADPLLGVQQQLCTSDAHESFEDALTVPNSLQSQSRPSESAYVERRPQQALDVTGSRKHQPSHQEGTVPGMLPTTPCTTIGSYSHERFAGIAMPADDNTPDLDLRFENSEEHSSEMGPSNDSISLSEYFSIFDVPETSGDQPQFMTNLGFAADSTLPNWLSLCNEINTP